MFILGKNIYPCQEHVKLIDKYHIGLGGSLLDWFLLFLAVNYNLVDILYILKGCQIPFYFGLFGTCGEFYCPRALVVIY